MTRTGWMGEAPDTEAPAMPLTSLVLGTKQREAGDTLAIAAARGRAAEARQARDEADRARDPDEFASSLIARGYMPGQASELSMKLADVTADLEAEREKIERGARRHEIAMREHAAGRMDAMAVQRMLDGDEGDAHRAEQLERRADSLRRQLQETAQLMVPPEARARNAVEEASSRARQILADVTAQRAADDAAEARGREQLRAERAAFRTAGGRLPFASSRGAAAEPDCAECAAAGASAEESFLIHSDQEPVPVPPAGGQEATRRGNFVLAAMPGAVPYCRDCGQVPGACACARMAYR